MLQLHSLPMFAIHIQCKTRIMILVMKNIIFSHPIYFTNDTSILSFSIKVPET